MAPPLRPIGSSSSVNRNGKSFLETFPRELRDRIYEYTFDHDIEDHGYRYQFRAPQPRLRLVSRQFMQEYDEQTPTSATLFVTMNDIQGVPQPSASTGLPYRRMPPRLATQCTELQITQNLEDAETWNTYGGVHRTTSSLISNNHDLHSLIGRPFPRMQEITVCLNLTFVRNFDLAYTTMASSFRVERTYKRYHPQDQPLPRSVITYNLRHLGLKYSEPPDHLAVNFIDFNDLQKPATLATFQDVNGKMQKVKNDYEIERRTKAESAILDGSRRRFRCGFHESAVMRDNFVDAKKRMWKIRKTTRLVGWRSPYQTV